MDKAMEGIEKEAREKIDRGEDMGHNKLLGALAGLLHEAQGFHFHDFLNTKHAMPKRELAMRFEQMREAAMNGEYDN